MWLRNAMIVVVIFFIGGAWLQHRAKVRQEEIAKQRAIEQREQFLRDSVQLEVLRRDSIQRANQAAYYAQQRDAYARENRAARDSMQENIRCIPRRTYEYDPKTRQNKLKAEVRQPGC
jgi:hypothetical protein